MDLPSQEKSGIMNLFLNPTLDEEWDIVIDNGQIVTISGIEYITQKLKSLLLTGLGEVKTDTNYGVPWLQEIIGTKNPNLDSIKTIILEVIDSDTVLEELGVVSSEMTSIDLDKTRNLTMNIKLKLSDDSDVIIDGVVI